MTLSCSNCRAKTFTFQENLDRLRKQNLDDDHLLICEIRSHVSAPSSPADPLESSTGWTSFPFPCVLESGSGKKILSTRASTRRFLPWTSFPFPCVLDPGKNSLHSRHHSPFPTLTPACFPPPPHPAVRVSAATKNSTADEEKWATIVEQRQKEQGSTGGAKKADKLWDVVLQVCRPAQTRARPSGARPRPAVGAMGTPESRTEYTRLNQL